MKRFFVLLLSVIILFSCETAEENKDTYTSVTFINNSNVCSIAEIHFTSDSYNEIIYLDEPLGGIFGNNKSITKSLKNIPSGNHSIKVCCIAGKFTFGTVGGQTVFEYGCSFSDEMYFNITEGESNTVTFN